MAVPAPTNNSGDHEETTSSSFLETSDIEVDMLPSSTSDKVNGKEVTEAADKETDKVPPCPLTTSEPGTFRTTVTKCLKRSIIAEDDPDIDNDGTYFAKLLKTVSTNGNNPEAIKQGQELTAAVPEKKLISQFKHDLLKILHQYFKTVFTILVKKRRLCPSEAFHTTKVLGLLVPRFLHPASKEYVDEVSKKLITLLARNVTQGCVMHVMIERNKTLHVIQRFVIKTVGSVELEKLLEEGNEFDEEYIRSQCRASLLHIMSLDVIKPILIPQFSRWSVSIGLKEEFMNMDPEKVNELWKCDPSGNYFPWRERPRNPVDKDITDGNNQQCQVSESSTSATTSNTENKEDSTNKITPTPTPPESESNPSTNTPTPVDKETQNESTMSHTPQNDKKGASSSGIICIPISSFMATPGLLINIYGLDYPAPPQSIVYKTMIHAPPPPPSPINKSFYRSTSTIAKLAAIRHRARTSNATNQAQSN